MIINLYKLTSFEITCLTTSANVTWATEMNCSFVDKLMRSHTSGLGSNPGRTLSFLKLWTINGVHVRSVTYSVRKWVKSFYAKFAFHCNFTKFLLSEKFSPPCPENFFFTRLSSPENFSPCSGNFSSPLRPRPQSKVINRGAVQHFEHSESVHRPDKPI